jgi:hypothetical protein
MEDGPMAPTQEAYDKLLALAHELYRTVNNGDYYDKDVRMTAEQAEELLLELGEKPVTPNEEEVLKGIPAEGSVDLYDLADQIGWQPYVLEDYVHDLERKGYLATEDVSHGKHTMISRGPGFPISQAA